MSMLTMIDCGQRKIAEMIDDEYVESTSDMCKDGKILSVIYVMEAWVKLHLLEALMITLVCH